MLTNISSTHLRTSFINTRKIKVYSFLRLLSLPKYNTLFSCSYINFSSISNYSQKISISQLKSNYFNHTHVRKIAFLKSDFVLDKKDCNFFIKHNVFPYSYINSASISTSSQKLSITQLKSCRVNYSHVGKVVFLMYENLLDKKVDKFCVSSVSINELVLRVFHVCPESARKFLSVCNLEPENVFDFLDGFELACQKSGFDVAVVECLWGVFRKVTENNEGFKHLPKSFEVMACMLINVGMFSEVELLGFKAERKGISLASDEIFSGLIEGYVNAGELQKALLLYDQLKGRRLVLSLSCYRSIIHVLMKYRKTECAIEVFENVVEAGFKVGDVETRNLERLIELLCWDGKMMEARKLLTKVVSTGWKPSRVILTDVANAYCEKRDFDDLLHFFSEMKCLPDILVGNKITHFLCCNFGVNRAVSFLWELEKLGFSPNEITFGIFICFCCREGKLRDSFCFLSDMLSRGLKPDRHSYNALISALFKAGMTEHAPHVFNDMIDNGIKPDLATFRALLAGYCNHRQFDEVKLLIHEMANYGFVNLSALEDPISKCFSVLGLDPLTVKVKRDNDLKNFRAEFVDELGNGLYLDTNLDDFEKTVSGVLEESLVPNFNLLVSRFCVSQNVKETLFKINEMAQWGQELSPSVLSEFVRLIYDSNSRFKAIPIQLKNVCELFSKLDHETLNLLIQVLSKSGFTEKCMLLIDEMRRRNLRITSATLNSMLISLCKQGKIADILYYLDISQNGTWLPEWKTFIYLVDCLGHGRRLKELLELFDIMMMSYPDSMMQICDVFLQKICSAGFTSVGDILVNELKQHYEFDQIFSKNGLPSKKVSSTFQEGYFLNSDLNIAKELLCFMMKRRIGFKNALDLSNQIQLRGWNHLCSSVHYALLDDMISDNRILEAETLCLQVIEKRQTFDRTLNNNLIKKFKEYGRLETAVNILDQILKMRNVPDAASYDCIVQGFCEYNDLNRAMEFFTEMLHRNLNPSLETCDLLIEKFCIQGNSEHAEGVLNSMVQVGLTPTKKMYSVVIDQYRLKNNLSKASELLNKMQHHGYEPDFGTQWSIINCLSNSHDRQGSHQGFLSRLLSGSGFLDEGRTKSKLR